MVIKTYNVDSSFNRATRRVEVREIESGFFSVPRDVELQLRLLARDYQCSVAEMVSTALRFYFGDGKNHLMCEHCDFYSQDEKGCKMPEKGEQTTMPLLDKGIVVVGQPSIDQGF